MVLEGQNWSRQLCPWDVRLSETLSAPMNEEVRKSLNCFSHSHRLVETVPGWAVEELNKDLNVKRNVRLVPRGSSLHLQYCVY